MSDSGAHLHCLVTGRNREVDNDNATCHISTQEKPKRRKLPVSRYKLAKVNEVVTLERVSEIWNVSLARFEIPGNCEISSVT